MSSSLSSSETKSLRFSKEVNSLESQLNDAKVINKTHSRTGFYITSARDTCTAVIHTWASLFGSLTGIAAG